MCFLCHPWLFCQIVGAHCCCIHVSVCNGFLFLLERKSSWGPSVWRGWAPTTGHRLLPRALYFKNRTEIRCWNYCLYTPQLYSGCPDWFHYRLIEVEFTFHGHLPPPSELTINLPKFMSKLHSFFRCVSAMQDAWPHSLQGICRLLLVATDNI